MREIGAVARRSRSFLAQRRPFFSLIRGADSGLRIVARSTRVRLYFHPFAVPADDRSCNWLHGEGYRGWKEVDDRELLVERVAALDLGKAGLEACVRVPHPTWPGRSMQELRGHGTTSTC